jgi:cell division protease FtsH
MNSIKQNPANQFKSSQQASPDQKKKPPLPPGRHWLWFLALLLLNYFFSTMIFPGPEKPVNVPYTLFKNEVEKNNVKAIFTKGEIISGKFIQPVQYKSTADSAKRTDTSKSVTTFSTILPSFVDNGLEGLLISHGVEILAEPINVQPSFLQRLLSSFGPALVLIAFYVWMYYRGQKQGVGMSGLMGIGKSRAKRFDNTTDQKVTFEDVAGIDEAERRISRSSGFFA